MRMDESPVEVFSEFNTNARPLVVVGTAAGILPTRLFRKVSVRIVPALGSPGMPSWSFFDVSSLLVRLFGFALEHGTRLKPDAAHLDGFGFSAYAGRAIVDDLVRGCDATP